MKKLQSISFFLSACLFLGAKSISANEPGDAWSYEITPYLWAAGIDGNFAIGGVSSPVNNDYELFVLENVDAVASVAIEAKRNRWSILFDAFYVKFSDDFDNRLFTTYFSTDGGFVEGAVSYQLEPNNPLELLGGLRYITADVELDLTPGPSAKDSEDWFDPFVGLRYQHNFDSKWSASFRGDIGGGFSADLVTNAAIVITYHITKKTNLKLGYRYMNIDFEQDEFIYDATFSGVGVGLGIRF